MRTIRTKVYKFNELNETAQNKAIETLSDINVHYDWWAYIYENAEIIGLKITGFDEGYRVTGNLLYSAMETSDLILKEHGDTCETYKSAVLFQKEWALAVADHSDGKDLDKVCEGKEDEFDLVADRLEDGLLSAILKDYGKDLRDEYDYRTGREAIIESIESNNYEFYQDGTLFNVK